MTEAINEDLGAPGLAFETWETKQKTLTHITAPRKLQRYTPAGNPMPEAPMPTLEKLDLKKQWKHLYKPPLGEITTVTVPPLTYLMVDGEGDPNRSKSFEQAVEALYSLSYTLKFSLKKSPRAIDYGVMPLEGLWWADDPRVFIQADKSAWKWTAMILQPEFITRSDIDAAFDEVRRKKNPAALGRVRFETLAEGESVQTLYLGPFSEEGPTIQRIHEAIHAAGKQLHGKHHEIYLSDPRRNVPAKLRTILRQPMR